jgi:hypothetical protein
MWCRDYGQHQMMFQRGADLGMVPTIPGRCSSPIAAGS